MMRPFLSKFEVEIPPEEKSAFQISYDPERMILMIDGAPAVERPDLLREPQTRKTFIAQETTDDS
jgi:hypothetical protein